MTDQVRYTNFLQAIQVNQNLCKLITNEECVEFAKAICKDLRGKTNRENIIEEIVDVSICIEWIKKIHKITEQELKEMMDYKTKRIVDRLNNKEFK